MLLDGLRQQRHLLSASNKNYFRKASKSSAELAVYVFVNLRMRREKFEIFFNHSFNNGDLHLLPKFHGDSCRIKD